MATKILSENHWKVPTFYKQRITRKELQQILLNNEDTAIIQGRVMDLKHKSIGAGIYEVWFEKKEVGKEVKLPPVDDSKGARTKD